MTEEIESPVESVSEDLHHHAEHSSESWLKWCALLAATYAVLAAVAGLQSSHFANDAMIEQIDGHRLDRTVHSWKSFTAKQINRRLDSDGRVWARDYSLRPRRAALSQCNLLC